MISFVSGIVVNKAAASPRGPYFEVNLHGLGLTVLTSARSVESGPQIGETAEIYTSLVVREDALYLVGFNTREERDLFDILHSASGVGTKVALSLLSALSVSEIAQAVVSGNHKPLTAAKGVGPKLAQKMTVDLKEKMTAWRTEDMGRLAATGTVMPGAPGGAAFAEAEAVLLSLGYGPDEISRSFNTVTKRHMSAEALSSEEILRESLGWLTTHAV